MPNKTFSNFSNEISGIAISNITLDKIEHEELFKSLFRQYCIYRKTLDPQKGKAKTINKEAQEEELIKKPDETSIKQVKVTLKKVSDSSEIIINFLNNIDFYEAYLGIKSPLGEITNNKNFNLAQTIEKLRGIQRLSDQAKNTPYKNKETYSSLVFKTLVYKTYKILCRHLEENQISYSGQYGFLEIISKMTNLENNDSLRQRVHKYLSINI